jgi:hypothetical protein
MLQIFITIKNPSLRLGLNPWNLGPMVYMLTITSLKQLLYDAYQYINIYQSNKKYKNIKMIWSNLEETILWKFNFI